LNVKQAQSNNPFDGAEKYRGALQDHCLSIGIQLHPTNADQNAVVKRTHRSLKEIAVYLMMDAKNRRIP
jgi:hypothetical protein